MTKKKSSGHLPLIKVRGRPLAALTRYGDLDPVLNDSEANDKKRLIRLRVIRSMACGVIKTNNDTDLFPMTAKRNDY